MNTDKLTIRTADGITFSYTLASPVSRLLAVFVDFFVFVALSTAAGMVLGIFGLISPDLANAFLMVCYFVIGIGYPMVMELFWKGRTLGKKALGLQVMDATGLKLKPSQVVLRNLLRAVDALPGLYALGGIVCALSPKAQRLGDLAAGTVVIRHREMPRIRYDEVINEKYNSLREFPHLEARLRQKASPGDLALATNALLRRDSLDPQARVEIYDKIAAYFKDLVPFPEEAVDGISSEQYLRNVIESVYRAVR